ncbi:MAG: hypothetical protein WBN90_12890, partial [Gammaproteobacteria bacterium]
MDSPNKLPSLLAAAAMALLLALSGNARAAVDIQKSTNGVDADIPGEAVPLAPGDPVTWEYVVSNTGNEILLFDTLTIPVVDDQGVTVNCPLNVPPLSTGILPPPQSFTCTASGTAIDLGGFCDEDVFYVNTATVNAFDATEVPVFDTDPSHYCNPRPLVPAITIEKATNGVDADNPNAGDAPQVAPGGVVTWTYVVTNTGTDELNNVAVIDDQSVSVSCPQTTLIPTQSMTCTASGLADDLNTTGFTTVPGQCGGVPNTPLYENIGSVSANGLSSQISVNDADPSHYCNPQLPAVDIEKATNGVDADDPNGSDVPPVAPGSPVSWTYVVTNTGNEPLDNVAVVDDQGVLVSCSQDTLAPGATITCTATGSADDLNTTGFTTVPGQCGGVTNTPVYENFGSVSATGSNSGAPVSDADPSHYCNPQLPAIDIEKSTNGVDADDPNGSNVPQVAPGGLVTWEYVVTNTGNEPLNNIAVVDDQGVPVSCPQNTTLAPGASITCDASDFAEDLDNTGSTTVPGQCGGVTNTPLYENFGSVSATGSNSGTPVSDEDPSHYCNPQLPAIDIEKSTNGVDADNPNAGDAPQVMSGEPVNWEYVVTNTGKLPLFNVEVEDDQGVSVSCPPDDTLAPGASITCRASGLADDLNSTVFKTVPGLCGDVPNTPMYANTGTATGTPDFEESVSDVDPSHYCNPQLSAIDIEKATNGVDADDPNAGNAPQVMPGDSVTWTYVVTNTGNTTLNEVAVNDDQIGPITCPKTTLAPMKSMNCSASGTAEDLDTTGFTTVPGLC